MQNLIPDILRMVASIEAQPVLQKAVATLMQPVVRRIADHILSRPTLPQEPLLDVAGALGVLGVYANQATKTVTRPALPAPAAPVALPAAPVAANAVDAAVVAA